VCTPGTVHRAVAVLLDVPPPAVMVPPPSTMVHVYPVIPASVVYVLAEAFKEPEQVVAGPVITGTGSGLSVTGSDEATPSPLTPVPYTLTFPETDAGPKLRVMEFVPNPSTIVAPIGILHTYVVALAIGSTVYTMPVLLWQTDAEPAILPAFAGSGITATVFELLLIRLELQALTR